MRNRLYTVATQREFEQIFKGYKFERYANNYYSGEKFDVLVTGIGKVNAAIELAIACKPFKFVGVQCEVINIGVCGASPEFSIGQVVDDIGKVGEHDFSTEPFDNYFKIIEEHTITICEQWEIELLTADKVAIEDHGYTDTLYDMEGYAIAKVCEKHNQKCLLVKAVTDIVGTESQAKDYDANFEIACAGLNKWVKYYQNKKGNGND